jgi:hypothetical protein
MSRVRLLSGEVGLGDAVSMAGRPLDQLDPVAVRVGDPTGPRPVRAVGKPGRLGRDRLGGKVGDGGVQRLDLDDEVVDPGARSTVPLAGSWTSSMLTKSSPGSRSMVRLPNAVPSTVPTTV